LYWQELKIERNIVSIYHCLKGSNPDSLGITAKQLSKYEAQISNSKLSETRDISNSVILRQMSETVC